MEIKIDIYEMYETGVSATSAAHLIGYTQEDLAKTKITEFAGSIILSATDLEEKGLSLYNIKMIEYLNMILAKL